MSALPDHLQKLADQLPLPDISLLNPLAKAELLRPYLQRLLLDKLCQEIEPPASDSDSLQRLTRRLGLKDLAELDGWRLALGLGLQAIEAQASFDICLNQATEKVWGTEVPSRFLEQRSRYDQVVLSLLRFEDADLAQELYFQVREGESSFGDLIDAYAGDNPQLIRGQMGPVALQRLHPLLIRVVERYEEGDVVPPLDIEGTVHLIRVESVRKAQLDEAMRSQLLQEMRLEWLDGQLLRLQARIIALNPSPQEPMELKGA
jgi:parvulin-like peptidyl-prolyl isomerase